MRPLIGICAAVEAASWGSWQLEVNLSPRSYAEAVQLAGGLALLLPPDDEVAEAPDQLLDMLDALVLAGGSDIDPASYGARPDPETRGTRPERDRFELALAHRALERGMPVLGICRGMELLNVALGGTLEQHIERVDIHRHTPGAFCDHAVRLEPGTLAAQAVGAERTEVKSHHHQAVDELGEGLVVSGWSEPDDLPEAIELPGKPFALGVLWHPEEDERSRVVGALVTAAGERVTA
ncbi:MAG TPA: gamma-glutamyl-gamma-aminobutyrate hydrolase family protein [Thermoleophilaceae bacterium]